jgi:hypothetical protein
MQAPVPAFDYVFFNVRRLTLGFDDKDALHLLSPLRLFLTGEDGMSKFLLGRRQFALGAAAAATTALIPKGNGLTIDALAQAAEAGNQPPDPQSLEAKTKAAMAKLSASAQAEVEMKVASIFRKYGDRLSDEQKADIRRIMAESQEGLEKMRAFKLENSDQPADAFHAYRAEAKISVAKEKLGEAEQKPGAAKQKSAQSKSQKENR